MTAAFDNSYSPDLDDLFCMEDDLSCNESMEACLPQMNGTTEQQQQMNYALPSELWSVSADPVFDAPRVLANILTRSRQFETPAVDYFRTVQTEVRPHMRKIVSDWMLDVCEEQQCHPEVFHLAINYVDRVLSRVNIGKHQFQLLGCVAMFLASKFKETCPLPSENLVIYTDNSVSVKDITVSPCSLTLHNWHF